MSEHVVPCPFCEEIGECEHDLTMLRTWAAMIDVMNDEADALDELGTDEVLG